MRNRVPLILLTISLMSLMVNVAIAQEACRESVREALEDKFQSDHSQLKLDYRIGTWLSGVDTAQYQTVNISKAHGITEVNSEDMTYYKNDKTIIRLLHDQKVIYVTGARAVDTAPYLDGLKILYDTLLSDAKILECYEECKQDRDLKTVTFSLSGKLRERFRIDRMSYLLEDQALKSMVIHYTGEQVFQKVEIELMNWQDTSGEGTEIDERTVLALDQPTSIKELFPQYTLIDRRDP